MGPRCGRAVKRQRSRIPQEDYMSCKRRKQQGMPTVRRQRTSITRYGADASPTTGSSRFSATTTRRTGSGTRSCNLSSNSRKMTAASPNRYQVVLLFTLLTALLTAPTVVDAACDESVYSSGADCDDQIYNVRDASSAGGGTGLYGTLIVYSLLTAIVGWIALLYPFYFVPKFQSKVRGYVDLGYKRRGTIVSMRRGRVFNPLRFCLPSRHNCYVTVMFGGSTHGSAADTAAAASGTDAAASSAPPPNEGTAGAQPAAIVPAPTGGAATTAITTTGSNNTGTIRKELVIEEEALQLLIDRSSHSIDVYTAGPSYPASGMLNDAYQGQRVTLWFQLCYALGGLSLLGLALSLSFWVTADHLYTSPHMWKFWLVLLGHFISLGLAYWSCHFQYRKRVEALLYGTIDDGTAAYGRCGIASMEKGDMGGGGAGGVVEIPDTPVGSMNSLEAGQGGGGVSGGKESDYHAMT